MKTKIVERLLEEKHITAEEAVMLLKQYVHPQTDYNFNEQNILDKVKYSEICSCNFKNGGSGICGCIMGNKLVDKNYKTNFNSYTNNSNQTELELNSYVKNEIGEFNFRKELKRLFDKSYTDNELFEAIDELYEKVNKNNL